MGLGAVLSDGGNLLQLELAVSIVLAVLVELVDNRSGNSMLGNTVLVLKAYSLTFQRKSVA